MLQKIREYIKTHGEKIDNNSYIIPEKNITEFLGLIKDITITEDSHFGLLSYRFASKYPYCYGKASFIIEDNRIYIRGNHELSLVYTGCTISDPAFKNLRINDYGDHLQLLFDYLINGSYAKKCFIFDIGRTCTNDSISKEIQQFRVNFNLNRKEEAEGHLLTAEMLSCANDALLSSLHSCITARKLLEAKGTTARFPEGSAVYILDKVRLNKTGKINNANQVILEGGKTLSLNACDVSLKPYPLDYSTLKRIQNTICAVSIPYLMLNNVYYTKKGNIVIRYKGMNGLEDPEIVKKVYSAVLKDVLPAAEVHAFTNCKEIFEKIKDAYDIFARIWTSDFEYLTQAKQNSLPEENFTRDTTPEIEEPEAESEENCVYTETAEPEKDKKPFSQNLF